MRKLIQKIFFLAAMVSLFGILSVGCSSSYCPGVDGTGNSAALKKSGTSGSKCVGVASTGTIKPKRKNKIEDGLFDPKMAKAARKKTKAKKVQSKMLSADQ